LRKVIDLIHPHPYNRDTRGAQAVGLQPFIPCGESRQNQGTQDYEEHLDLPGVTQESPLLEIPSIASADTLAGSKEHTPVVPSVVEESIDEVFRVVSEFLGDSNEQ